MLVTSALIALAIAVTSLVAISALRAQMVHQLDDEMKAYYGNNSNSLDAVTSDQGLAPVTASGAYRIYFLDEQGEVIYSTSRNWTSDESDEPQVRNSGWTVEKVRKNNETGMTVTSKSGSKDWRILPIIVSDNSWIDGKKPASAIIALPLEQTNQVVALVGVLTFTFGLATLAAATAMTWVLVTRTFEPLARVEQTAAKIAAGDLSQRIEHYNPNNEVGNLAVSLNTMLTQVEASFNAQAKSEAKMRQFVGDASHELRTPLVSIRGYSELYRQGALRDNEAIGTAMGRIEAESKRMGQLIEDLLTLARIDERRESKLAPFDLFHLAVDATNDAYASAPDRQITLVGLTDEVAPSSAPVVGDESRMRQVVGNLITNAMRYTPKGSPLEIAVGVRYDSTGQYSVIEIRDHGPGIHGEDRERVFERFYRTDTSRSRETGGTGLGLSIVAAIIEQHEGSIRISDTGGGGATFVVSLPLHYPAVPVKS